MKKDDLKTLRKPFNFGSLLMFKLLQVLSNFDQSNEFEFFL